MDVEIIVPIAFFGAIAATVWLFLQFGFKKRLTVHETIRLAIEKGQEVSPETIQNLSLATDPVISDLRRGVICLSVGIAISLFGLIIGGDDPDALRPLFGIAMFPALIGFAYLGLWRFGHARTVD